MTRSWFAAALSALLLGLALSSTSAAIAAEASPDDEGNLSVVIVDGSSPTPTPTSRPQQSGVGSGSNTGSGSSGSGGSGSSGAGTPAGSSGGGSVSTPATDEVSVSGMVYVGGLNSSVVISPAPGEGVVTLWLTVRNASTSTIDAKANFWMNSQLFGNRLDSADGIEVLALQPGESRIVKAELQNAGQWTLLDAHVTLTPPETVDGVALTPVTRDASVFVFPWLLVLGIAAILMGYFVFRAVRASSLAQPALADAT